MIIVYKLTKQTIILIKIAQPTLTIIPSQSNNITSQQSPIVITNTNLAYYCQYNFLVWMWLIPDADLFMSL